MTRREALSHLGKGGAAGLLAATAVLASQCQPIAAPAAELADAELLRLGDELLTAWKAELAVMDETRDDKSDEASARDMAAYEVRRDVVEKIASIPATTAAGLGVKCLAMATCEIDWASDDDTPELYIGDRLSAQIRRDARGVSA
ncbi:hypothetical protein [Aureimonas sp. N4]|uniref:hypothetical protein n=1 Tax=Aureimonas sp. N4 TaxID=1638165 RepID=UPI000780E367|nr:hypothetical protein [Aureimonas sp. N4]